MCPTRARWYLFFVHLERYTSFASFVLGVTLGFTFLKKKLVSNQSTAPPCAATTYPTRHCRIGRVVGGVKTPPLKLDLKSPRVAGARLPLPE